MDLNTAKNLSVGEHIVNTENNRRFKVNGKPKTWKRNPKRIEIPVKYGLYIYGYFNETDLYKLEKEVF